tara:strand:+ start:3938 stop:5287 length:1350 start_codon:yes stop_codon:yes gene_type:complete
MDNFLKKIYFIITLFLLSSCSFQNTGSFFKDHSKDLEKEIFKKNTKLVFSEAKNFKKEITGITEAKIPEEVINSNWLETNYKKQNYIPHLKYNSSNNLIYKSKKLGQNKFDTTDLSFETLIYDNNIFLYDLSGNVFKFSILNKKLVWKFNFYKKRYKKIPIYLKLKISDNNLIVSDNLGYLYILDIQTGNLNWAKNFGVPFRSSIKTEKENIFLLNQDNKFYIINKKDGEKKTNFETFPSILKSELETSISLDQSKNNLFFVTSAGQLYSINYKTNNLNWLINLSMTNKGQSKKFFFSSPIIFKKDTLYISTSISTYSINAINGSINWELPFSTYVRPVISENFIILASNDGFILNLDIKTGKVLWSKSLFKSSDKLNPKKIGQIKSLLLASNKILVSTSKGFFIFIDYKDGKIFNFTKASGNGFFSNPVIVNKKIFVVDNKTRILIFD